MDHQQTKSRKPLTLHVVHSWDQFPASKAGLSISIFNRGSCRGEKENTIRSQQNSHIEGTISINKCIELQLQQFNLHHPSYFEHHVHSFWYNLDLFWNRHVESEAVFSPPKDISEKYFSSKRCNMIYHWWDSHHEAIKTSSNMEVNKLTCYIYRTWLIQQ